MKNMIASLPIIICLLVFSNPNSSLALHRQYILQVNQIGFKEQPETQNLQYFAPAGSIFDILEEQTDTYIVRFLKVADESKKSKVFFQSSFAFTLDSAPMIVKEKTNYVIEKDLMLRYNYYLNFGLIIGGLAAPFKLQTFDGTISSGGTLGACVGLQQRWLGFPTIMLLSGGLCRIALNDITSTSVDYKWGISVATGIVAAVKEVQLGVLAGIDHLGGESGRAYKYEDKLWVGFSVGFTFID